MSCSLGGNCFTWLPMASITGHSWPRHPGISAKLSLCCWLLPSSRCLSRARSFTFCPVCSRSQRSSGAKKQQIHESSRPLSIERPGAVHPWVSAQLRNSVQPSHLFIQDPTMPPNPAPNPLTQLEEARRRLEEEEKRASKLPSKQRYRAIEESRA